MFRVECSQRFIGENQRSFARHSAGEMDAGEFTARQSVSAAVFKTREIAVFDRLFDGFPVCGVQPTGACAIGKPAQRDGIRNADRPGERTRLRQIADQSRAV